MQSNRTRRAGQARPLDLGALAEQVAGAAGAPTIDLPATDGERMLDRRGYRRPSHLLPGARRGQAPKNKGREYPPDPPTTAEVVALLEACDGVPDVAELQRTINDPARTRISPTLRAAVRNARLRGLIIVLWRGGLRISEALALRETDLNAAEHSLVVQHGKGDKRRVVGMDPWAWEHLLPWLELRRAFPPGPLFCVIEGPTTGTSAWRSNDARQAIHRLARKLGIRRRMAPHQFRHAHAVELAREGTGLHIVSRQLGHANLAITTTYLQGISPEEIVGAVAARRPPMVTALSGGIAVDPPRGPEVEVLPPGTRRAPAWSATDEKAPTPRRRPVSSFNDDYAQVRVRDAAHEFSLSPAAEWSAAPGLEVADLDELAKRHYARGRVEGFERGFREGQEQGQRSGRALALREVAAAVGEVVNRRLIHIERRMRDRQDRQRSTIKAERAFMVEQAAELDVSVQNLREIASWS